MQLASHGVVRPLGRAAQHVAQHIRTGGARTLHIPTGGPIPPLRPTPSVAQRTFSTARTFASRFVAHLTAPGLGAVRSSSAGSTAHALQSRAYTAAARQPATARLSLPARAALGRPLGAPHLPRAPAVPRCSVTTLGLGSARSFHSGRPIFASVAENAPLLLRAGCEADVDVKKRRGEAKSALRALKAKTEDERQAREQMMKPKAPKIASVTKEEPTQEEELERYFPAAPVASVSTHVLVPLAPMPTSRMPLPAFPSSSAGQLLPIRALGALHASHSTHALRVSSLFDRLDTASVWTRGARCEAYGDASGTCIVLRIIFDGWTESEVRKVLGEGGKGWGEVIEVREDAKHNGDDLSDGMSSGTVTPVEDVLAHSTMDPAQSLVLPTLDFSSSFLDASSSPAPSPALSRTSSDLSAFTFAQPASDGYASDEDDDALSDYSLSSDGSADGSVDLCGITDARSVGSSDGASWVGVGFSSRFAERMEGVEDGPREYPLKQFFT